jgi:hypothetical protein
MNAPDAIKELQTTWNELTRQELHPKATERLFFEFWRNDFTSDDLRCVLMYYLRFNRENSGAQFRINAQKILGDLETFASTLGEARAKERNRRAAQTPREAVAALRTRPVDPEQSSTQGATVAAPVKGALRAALDEILKEEKP